jgi:hypothetical protein
MIQAVPIINSPSRLIIDAYNSKHTFFKRFEIRFHLCDEILAQSSDSTNSVQLLDNTDFHFCIEFKLIHPRVERNTQADPKEIDANDKWLGPFRIFSNHYHKNEWWL